MFFLAFLQSSYPVAREIRYVFPGALYVYANFDPLSPSSTFKNVGLQFFSPDFIVWFIVTAFVLLDHFKKKEKRKNPEKNNPPDQTSLPE